MTDRSISESDRPWLLTRVTLKRDAAAAALAPILLPGGRDAPMPLATGHRLMWSLFADAPERRRDFLWREIEPGRFLTYSARPPSHHGDLFHIDEPKPLDVPWRVGQRLAFSLRANPTVARRRGDGSRASRRRDVVMEGLYPLDSGAARRDARAGLERTQGLDWLTARAESRGFALDRATDGTPRVTVDGYRRHRVGRRGGGQAVLSSLDFDGLLTITDPAAFAAALRQGIGPAKAFGFGLLLVRPAPPGA
ncbi:type I-E CRISPR-associated protein Cas6/Cse3/CasE [Roseospirillum parvum]|uniref:CRISPR system Cascade subunit CasE n=1 Tax=Roseospirillum parvum TaxID=83401 RepID=A0A1G8EDF0_9PROT|nr:type I-E CRISPR-associated protein Cas6/Cse3/CasE [Roseospirillum parvum]SDH67917.1 CRISPR system Cascade subunit CasE [Roseospirillum parvum]